MVLYAQPHGLPRPSAARIPADRRHRLRRQGQELYLKLDCSPSDHRVRAVHPHAGHRHPRDELDGGAALPVHAARADRGRADLHHGQHACADAIPQGKLPAQVQDQQLGQHPDLCHRIRSALPACGFPVRPALSVGARRNDPAILHSGLPRRHALGAVHHVPHRGTQLRHEGRALHGSAPPALPVCGQGTGVRAGKGTGRTAHALGRDRDLRRQRPCLRTRRSQPCRPAV